MCSLKSRFHLGAEKRKRKFPFYFMCKNILLFELLLFFKPPFLGGVGVIFLSVLFVVLFVCFFAMLHFPKACWELSGHSASCFVGDFLTASPGGGGRWDGERVHGPVILCSLYFSEF